MKVIETWSEKITDKDQVDQSINDLCFRPDGTQLLVAAGSRILVYDPLDGNLIKALPGHKENIYCLSYAKDGSHFASGGADKMVIIWSAELEGSLRFHHNEAIQALAFNPLTNVLLTCAITDFGLWSFKDKSVPKTKVNSRITCCSWTHDGQFMALGFFNGTVQIRDKNGDEKIKLERPDGANSPIWCVEWTLAKNAGDILTVADWGQKLSFYLLNGKQAYKDRKLGFDATQINWHSSGELLLVSGSHRQCGLYSNEGIKLFQICESKDSWVLCAKHKPNSNFVAVGCQDGTIAVYQLIASMVHGLCKERYAYRDNMTEVIIQNLITDVKVRVKCKDLVKKLAIYKHRLAVQLSDKVVIYELESNDPKDMGYKGKKTISKKFECNLFVITSEHIVLCQDKRLDCLNLKGEKIREWTMEYTVSYIKVIGGPPGKEGILVGLKSGHVLEIFVDSSFPVQLVKLNNPIKYIDMSMHRQKLAVIDDNSTLFVYSLKSASGTGGGSDLLFQEPNANSVAWNTCFEDMLAISGGGNVSIIVSNFAPNRQRLKGLVVGFNGSTIYYLNGLSVASLEVPHSEPMLQYLGKKMFREAYEVACLGVTYKDWEQLAFAALEGYELDIARRAFVRTREYKYLNLIYQFQELKKQQGQAGAAGGGNSTKQLDTFLGYMYAYNSKFPEAAKAFRKAGEENLAMTMFTDLRMFDQAKEYIGGGQGDSDKTNILLKQAEWATRNGETKAAVELYINAKQYNKAIEIAGKNNWAELLLEIVRKLDKADRESLSKCGEYFKQMKMHNFAAEVYEKMGNIKELIEIRMEKNEWDEVFALARKYPDLNSLAHYKYGQWLAENDRFEEAQRAFNEAGFKRDAIKVLEELTHNAVSESRFNDASYYYMILSMEYLQNASEEPNDAARLALLRKFEQHQNLADVYYAYQNVHRYVVEPFTEHLPDTLFNASRYLLHAIAGSGGGSGRDQQLYQQTPPAGISKFKILYTAAKMAKDVKAFKYARSVLERLDELVINNKFSDEIELLCMNIKAKPFKDEDDLLPLCYRCGHHYSLLNPKGNDCSNCGQPFVFSFASFEPLPLVEFVIAEDISDEEALALIDYVPHDNTNNNSTAANLRESMSMGSARSGGGNNTNRLVIGGDDMMPSSHSGGGSKDPFTALMNKYSTSTSEHHRPVIVNREILKSIDPTHVFVCKWPAPLRWRFYKIILTEEPIVKCDNCNKFFHTDDFEMQLLQKGHCPFCRKSRDPNKKSPAKIKR